MTEEWRNHITEPESERLAQWQEDSQAGRISKDELKIMKRRLADTARARMRKEKQRERF